MKIMFLCGSLEPGKDGVGDYIRRLAVELSLQGHTIAAAAMFDSYVNDIVEWFEDINSTRFWILRLPATLGNRARFKNISGWVQQNNPNYISLQYVGFSFHRYGLPGNFIFLLKRAIGHTKVHLMLHELWCGMPAEAGRKERLLGTMQKKFLPLMLRVLKPAEISTSNRFYATELKRINIKAAVVPIFGNIQMDDFGSDDEWVDLMSAASLSSLITDPNKWLVLGFFGTVYRCPGLDDLLQAALQAANQVSLNLGLLAFGYNGKNDFSLIAKDVNGATYWQTGMLPSSMINRIVPLVNVGVITTPANRIDKSGSAAALLERGVPVLISPQDKTYSKRTMEPQGIYQVNEAADVLNAVAAKAGMPIINRLKQAVKFYSGLGPVVPVSI